MLISEIIALADAQSEETYTTEEWIDLFNLCQGDLTPDAKIPATKTGIAVTVTDGKASIVIADDADLVLAHEIKNVYYTPTGGAETQLRRLPISDRFSKGWRLDAANILMQGLGVTATGTATVDFYKKLAQIVYVASPESYTPSSPDIPSQYHGLYVSFLCAKSQQREEELEDKFDFWKEYTDAKGKFAFERIQQMEPYKVKNLLRAQRAQGGDAQ